MNFKNMKFIPKEELDKLIKSGQAKRIHLYNCQDMLRPRGAMKKESLSLYLFELLNSIYHDWTNIEYNDSPPKEILMTMLTKNLKEEVGIAIKEFKNQIKEEEKRRKLSVISGGKSEDKE